MMSQNEIFEENKILNYVFDNTSDLFIVLDMKGKIKRVNQTVINFFSCQENEIIGLSFKHIIGDLLEPETEDYKELNAHGVIKDIETEILRKGMDNGVVMLSAAIMKGKDNKPAGIFCSLKDITEMKAVQKKMSNITEELKSRDWLRTNIPNVFDRLQKTVDLDILGNTVLSELTAATNSCYGILYTNETFVHNSNNNRLILSNSYGCHNLEILPKYVNAEEGLLGQCMANKTDLYLNEIPPEHLENLSKVTEELPGSIAIIPIFFEDEVIGVIELGAFWEFTLEHKELFDHISASLGVLIYNILSRKQIERLLKESRSLVAKQEIQAKELRSINEQLKSTQLQLIHSEKLASIGQLAAGVAHEINNPIGFVNGNLSVLENYVKNYLEYQRLSQQLEDYVGENNFKDASILLKEMSGLKERENFEFMNEDIMNLLKESGKGLERVKKIVLDLRTFSSAHSDEKTEVNVEEILDEVLTMVNSEIKYKAQVTKEYAQIPKIKGNAQGLSQVFMNLLINAAQAIEEKGNIYLKTYVDKNSIGIHVRDTGKGIEESSIKNIFDAFYTTKPVGEGTGLGLSISHEIIKKHGGEITVQSEVGKGTVFLVTLPIL